MLIGFSVANMAYKIFRIFHSLHVKKKMRGYTAAILYFV